MPSDGPVVAVSIRFPATAASVRATLLRIFGPPAALDQAWRLALHDVARVGEDVRLIGRPSGASAP